MEFHWPTLPDHNFDGIFLYLDVKSLLRVTKTFQKLEKIVAKSSKLCRKILLKVLIDENVTSQLSAAKNSQRNYCNILLTPFRKDE